MDKLSGEKEGKTIYSREMKTGVFGVIMAHEL